MSTDTGVRCWSVDAPAAIGHDGERSFARGTQRPSTRAEVKARTPHFHRRVATGRRSRRIRGGVEERLNPGWGIGTHGGYNQAAYDAECAASQGRWNRRRKDGRLRSGPRSSRTPKPPSGGCPRGGMAEPLGRGGGTRGAAPRIPRTPHARNLKKWAEAGPPRRSTGCPGDRSRAAQSPVALEGSPRGSAS
jgi:hypothetical protein